MVRLMLATGAMVAGLVAFGTTANAVPLVSVTYVSGTGSDSQDCSFALPCQTFGGALAKTAAGGVITAIDAGNFGQVEISKSITLVGQPGVTGIAATTTGISITAGSNAQVNLIGINLNGGFVADTGINVSPAAGGVRVEIQNCIVTNFLGRGIRVTGSNEARVLVRDSLITQNQLGGMLVESSGSVKGVTIEDSTIDLNADAGLRATGAGVVVLISDTSIFRGQPGIVASGGATITSYGNNRIRNGTPTSTIPTN